MPVTVVLPPIPNVRGQFEGNTRPASMTVPCWPEAHLPEGLLSYAVEPRQGKGSRLSVAKIHAPQPVEKQGCDGSVWVDGRMFDHHAVSSAEFSSLPIAASSKVAPSGNLGRPVPVQATPANYSCSTGRSHSAAASVGSSARRCVSRHKAAANSSSWAGFTVGHCLCSLCENAATHVRSGTTFIFSIDEIYWLNIQYSSAGILQPEIVCGNRWMASKAP